MSKTFEPGQERGCTLQLRILHLHPPLRQLQKMVFKMTEILRLCRIESILI